MVMRRAGEKKQIDLLEGPLLPKIILFVIPLMCTNLLQAFYSAADMIIVSMSNVDGAVGSIGTTSALINLVLNLFSGFAIGANIVIARSIGRKNEEYTRKSVHTSVAVSALFGLLCCGIGLLVSRPLLTLMGNRGYVLDLSCVYTMWYFIGSPFISVSNNLIAVFRAKGDTRTPLFVLSFSGILNVLLNLFFVLVCGMSVEGVAIATAISNVVSAAVLMVILSKDDSWCRFSFRRLRVDRKAFLEILAVGLPASVQGALFSISNMMIQSSVIAINNIRCPGGSAVIDGNAAACSLEGFIYTATNSVYSAAVTFTSQHYGAKKFKRIGNVMRSCYFVTFVIALLGAAILVGFRNPLSRLYVTDPLALETANTRIMVVIMLYFLLAFMETGSGVLRGLGKSLLSTVISLVGSCVLRIVWILTVVKIHPSLEAIYISYPVSWAVTALFHFTCSSLLRRKYMRENPE